MTEFDRGLWLPCGPSSASSTREGAHAQEVYEPYSEEVKRGNGYSERVYRDTIGGSDAPRRSIRRICAALVVPAVIGALVSCALLASIGPYTVGHGSRKVLRRLFQDDADTESGTKGDDEDPPWWVFVVIPVVSGLVGWGTNYLAILMTFYPLEFKPFKVWQLEGSPFGLFGWQGIIPAKAKKMTTTITVMCRDKLIDMKEVFARLDPEHLAALMQEETKRAAKRALEESMSQEAPGLWSSLPQGVKDEVAAYMTKDATHFIRLLIEEIGERIYSVFDILNLTVTKTERNKSIIVHMFQETGQKEFRFLIFSGLYFGFLLGIPQSVIYIFYQGVWLLPAAGFAVGYLTNYLALLLIFSPVRPIRLFGGRVTLQGVFLKRQKEASERLAALSAHYFFRPADVWGEILNGAYRANMDRLMEDVTDKYMRQYVRKTVPGAAAAMMLGADAFRRVQEKTAEVLKEELPNMLPASYDYMEDAMEAEATLRESLENLPPEEFDGVLHPVFKEDEIKLILVGGVLGALAGALQVLVYGYI